MHPNAVVMENPIPSLAGLALRETVWAAHALRADDVTFSIEPSPDVPDSLHVGDRVAVAHRANPAAPLRIQFDATVAIGGPRPARADETKDTVSPKSKFVLALRLQGPDATALAALDAAFMSAIVQPQIIEPAAPAASSRWMKTKLPPRGKSLSTHSSAAEPMGQPTTVVSVGIVGWGAAVRDIVRDASRPRAHAVVTWSQLGMDAPQPPETYGDDEQVTTVALPRTLFRVQAAANPGEADAAPVAVTVRDGVPCWAGPQDMVCGARVRAVVEVTGRTTSRTTPCGKPTVSLGVDLRAFSLTCI